MTDKILLVGKNSFIASSWICSNPDLFIALDHKEINNDVNYRSSVAINFSISPDFKSNNYSEKNDLDLKAARHAYNLGIRFVMLSTRKVYKQSERLVVLNETSSLEPSDYYGENKLESERRIISLLGDHCTILRMSNVYGYEFGRRSFFGLAMSRLHSERRIVLDISPFTERDFISVEQVGFILTKICSEPCSGIYNLGSGLSLPLGRIAQWLIQGFGQGVLEVIDLAERDSFGIDNSKLLKKLGIASLEDNFEEHIKNLGLILNNE